MDVEIRKQVSTRPNESDLGFFQEGAPFSLVLGGPLYQLLHRTHLTGDALELARRRIFAISLIAWSPLLVLSAAEKLAFGGYVQVPFLYDIDIHTRFLVALPLLIGAELVVHERMRPMIGQFLARNLIPESAHSRFVAAVNSAVRLRNSILAELLILAFVYTVGVLILWKHHFALQTAATWYRPRINGELRLSLAGLWYGYLSLPLFQFILMRWYFRMFIWTRFLWQVSRIELSLVPTHPDGAGGLGFLGSTAYAFTPLLMAHGVLFAGLIFNRILYEGAKLTQFKIEIVAVVVVLLIMVLSPLLVFTTQLYRTKRMGMREYGVLAERYVREFDYKWLRGGAPAEEPLMGSGDIQSLADLANSFAVIRSMRGVPFTKETVLQLAIVTLAPLLPLTLTMISLDELLTRLLSSLF